MTVRAANEPIEWAILWQTFVGLIGAAVESAFTVGYVDDL
jgi:hypothetical protein